MSCNDLRDPLDLGEEKPIEIKKVRNKTANNTKKFTYVKIDSLISKDASSTNEIPCKSEKPTSPEKCLTCNKFVPNLSTHRHKRKATPKRQVCQFCKKIFTNKSKFALHLKNHPESRPWQCETCSETFSNASSLENHKLKHIQEKPFKCSLCREAYADLAELDGHLKWHLEARPGNEKCLICNRFVPNLLTHRHKRKASPPPQVCRFCPMIFTNKSEFELHLKSHSESESKTYKCETCSATFPNTSSLKNHQLKHIEEKQFKCSQCSEAYADLAELNDHLKLHQEERPDKEKCLKCNKFVPNLSTHKHKRTRKPQVCRFCLMIFTNRAELELHLKCHEETKTYQCETCSATFPSTSCLKNHQLKHIQEKPFKCSLCREAYADLAELKGHLKLHQEERQYECQICGNGYVQSKALEAHMNFHLLDLGKKTNDNKRYNCSLCSKSYVHLSSLRGHMKIHKEEQSYKCPECGQSFHYIASFDEHLNQQHPNHTMFDCEFCGRKYSGSAVLKIHLRKMHSWR